MWWNYTVHGRTASHELPLYRVEERRPTSWRPPFSTYRCHFLSGQGWILGASGTTPRQMCSFPSGIQPTQTSPKPPESTRQLSRTRRGKGRLQSTRRSLGGILSLRGYIIGGGASNARKRRPPSKSSPIASLPREKSLVPRRKVNIRLSINPRPSSLCFAERALVLLAVPPWAPLLEFAGVGRDRRATGYEEIATSFYSALEPVVVAEGFVSKPNLWE